MSDYTNNKAEWVTVKSETEIGANTADRVGTAGENTSNLVASATGYGNYRDTLYTSVAPLTVVADTTTDLPNNKLGGDESQLPLGVTTFYDGTVIKGLEGDGMNILIEFKIKPTSVAATTIEVWFDIGLNPLFKRLTGFPKGNGVERPISFTTLAFNGATWAANGATIKFNVNGSAEIYDIRYLIARVHKAI